MKLKLLRGIVYNVCDHIASPRFYPTISKEKIPFNGKWIIDLKNHKVLDDKGNSIKLAFEKEIYEWFSNELEKANIPLNEIDEAKVIVEFGSSEENNFDSNKVDCTIIVGNRKYYNKRFFDLF